MTQEKRVSVPGLQVGFTPQTGYAAPTGDVVCLDGTGKIFKAPVGSQFVLGHIGVGQPSSTTYTPVGWDYENNASRVTVFTKFNSLRAMTSGAAFECGPVVLLDSGKVAKWSKVTASGSQTITLAVNATGDGAITLTIAGVDVSYSPAASATPTTSAAALVALINANGELRARGISASNSSGVITVATNGAVSDGATVVAVSADSTTTATAGGATITGGAGYPIESVYGIAINAATGADEDVQVLTMD